MAYFTYLKVKSSDSSWTRSYNITKSLANLLHSISLPPRKLLEPQNFDSTKKNKKLIYLPHETRQKTMKVINRVELGSVVTQSANDITGGLSETFGHLKTFEGLSTFSAWFQLKKKTQSEDYIEYGTEPTDVLLSNLPIKFKSYEILLILMKS